MLRAAFAAEAPYFVNSFDRAAAMFGEEWARNFEVTLRELLGAEPAVTAAVQGYADFAMDALRLHKRFEKTGEYEAKSYADASSEVYLNAGYMNDLYLPGIMLSHFLWPHHYRQRLFFEANFLPEMSAKAGSARFAEIGTGTGYYSRLALTRVADSRCDGFDISPSSAAYTRRQWQAFGVEERAALHLKDITREAPAGEFDWAVSVEVLEHLEDPTGFLAAIHRMMRPEGKAFITAALNAPNADHIYLYRHPDEVRRQLEEVGFTIEQYYFGSAYRPRTAGVPVPESAAFIVSRGEP